MANEFDKYREALVMEHTTTWPADYDHWAPDSKAKIETLLHAEPEQAVDLEYVRQHTGFLRQIVVTEADLQRLGISVAGGANS
jgi:hypothetical protein